jgi:hypothetical protein
VAYPTAGRSLKDTYDTKNEAAQHRDDTHTH